jgi:hypothetical protein
MKKDQALTPKYWIGHNVNTDDVYLKTAAKGFDEAEGHMIRIFGENWWDDPANRIELFEINLVP